MSAPKEGQPWPDSSRCGLWTVVVAHEDGDFLGWVVYSQVWVLALLVPLLCAGEHAATVDVTMSEDGRGLDRGTTQADNDEKVLPYSAHLCLTSVFLVLVTTVSYFQL